MNSQCLGMHQILNNGRFKEKVGVQQCGCSATSKKLYPKCLHVCLIFWPKLSKLCLLRLE